jgi:adenylate cyclase
MHCHVGFLGLLTRDEALLERHIVAIAAISTEHQLGLWQDFASMWQALIVAGAGDALGIDQFMVADTRYTASKSHVFLTLIRIEASYRALALDLVEKAWTLADMARTLIDQTGEAYLLADLYRLEGALALKADNQNDAEVSLKEAVAVARKQGSKSLELRAALDLANLWQAMGRTTEACSVLKLAQDNIADGDCAEDIARAKVFLGGI